MSEPDSDASGATVVARPLRPGRPGEHHLRPGDVRTFGRGAADRPVDIPVSDRREVSRCIGQIAAVAEHWVLGNRSGRAVLVQSVDEGGSFITVPSGCRYEIPFVLSRVVWPHPRGRIELVDVFAMTDKRVDDAGPGGRGGGESTRAGVLRRDSKHFLVLLALCAPRLTGPDEHAVPPVADVVAELRRTATYPDATTASVNSQIEYLALRFGIRRSDAAAGGPRDDQKRLRIVEHALRFGLVTYADLGALLSPASGR